MPLTFWEASAVVSQTFDAAVLPFNNCTMSQVSKQKQDLGGLASCYGAAQNQDSKTGEGFSRLQFMNWVAVFL